jgi:hypothetical protein
MLLNRATPDLSALLGHVRVVDAAEVPELREDVRAVLVDGVGNLLPPRDLLGIPQARRVWPLRALRADEHALGEDQACAARCALRVVFLCHGPAVSGDDEGTRRTGERC